MARGARRHNMQNTEEVVYDSQEEHDEWPESHSSEGNPDRSLCSRDNSPGVFDDAEALPPLGTGSVSKFVQHDISRLESNDGDLPLNRDNPRQSAVTSPANDVPLSVPGISPTPPRRALRARKPEQKMPYTLDLMRHRDQFRRRGLKPVHNPDIRFSALEDDDQYQADEEEEVLDKDERYIPQKNVDGPAPKRRCVQQPNEAPGDNFELNIRIGPQKFLDPRKFDIYRQEDNVPRVDFQGEISDYTFDSDDGLSVPPEVRDPRRANPPRQTITSISVSPKIGGPREYSSSRTILVPSGSDYSDVDSLPDVPPAPGARTGPISSSSSSSSNEEIEQFKKKAKGVLPASFFTMRNRTAVKPTILRPTTGHDPERRGVAKTKINNNARQHPRLMYPVSSSEEELTPPRERRNFIDLTREEKIQDDMEGWDIEEDLIDRMLNWGGTRTTSNRRIKSKPHRRIENRGHFTTTTTKRKRQRRISEYTDHKAPRSASRKATHGPRLSITDACDVFRTRTNRSPPPFMKIAKRQTQRIRNFGRRRAPNRILFSFADEEDQQDVFTVIEEWENGTITEGIEKRAWFKPNQSSTRSQPRAVFQRRSQERPRKTTIKRAPLVPLQEENTLTAGDGTLVNKLVWPEAPIVAMTDGSKPCEHVIQNKATCFTRPAKRMARSPIPAWIPRRQPPFRRTNDIATWLRKTMDANQPPHHDQGFPDNENEPFSTPRMPRPKHRMRKARRPVRRDVNKFEKKFLRPVQAHGEAHKSLQLSLDDIWFPNDSTSLTFGVVAIPEGMYLDSTTLVGKRLIAMAVETKSAVETENNLWNHRARHVYLETDVACDKLATSLDRILDFIDDLRVPNVDEHTARKVHHEVLAFAEFVVEYLKGLSTAELNDIQTFGSKLLRLTEIAMNRLDGSVLTRPLDLNDQCTLLALSLYQSLSVACYQLCTLISHDISLLGADQVMSELGQRLIQYLLNGGFEPVQETIRKVRARTSRDEGLECDSILLDIWNTLYHVFTNVIEGLHQSIPSFWTLLKSALDVEGNLDGCVSDRAWYAIMNVSAITVFDVDGIVRLPTDRSDVRKSSTVWTIVEALVNPYLQSYSTTQHHRLDAYIRTLFGRCHTLIAQWGWTGGAKTILNIFYTFFTDRRFDNLKTEAFCGFPKFFQSDIPHQIQTVDSSFVIFLKLVASYITQQQIRLSLGNTDMSRREILTAAKDLDRFVNRVTPLRTYQSTFAPLDYIALQNQYSLLLTLYAVAPERSRPFLERIKDVIDIEMAPAPAQVICMETWGLLFQLQLKKSEDLTSVIEWFRFMFRHAMKEYQSAVRPSNNEDSAMTFQQTKSKVRALESIVLKGLQVLGDVSPLAAEAVGSLVEDITVLSVRSFHLLSPAVTQAVLNVLKNFFVVFNKEDTPRTGPSNVHIEQDSQDYGDISFVEEFVAAQDEATSFPTGVIVSNICNELYQVIANLFTNPKPPSDELSSIIDTWILGVSLLVRYHQQEWPTFLQYGGEWERLRSTRSKTSRVWCPYVLTKLLQANPNAYFQGQDKFISAWFESIIEPDLKQQHSLTTLLLNIDDKNIALLSSLFTRNSEGVYEVTGDALFEARPGLIVRNSPSSRISDVDALANIGKDFEKLLGEGDHAAISICKQRYLDYLHHMLSNMKSIYLEMKETDSDDLVQYISLTQHVVGNIIQHCSSFIKEIDRRFEDLPILDYFTNGETFPQPGSNEIAYAAQRLHGIVRKDRNRPFSNATQADIFWSIKSLLEKSVQNAQEREFIEFCVLAFCDTDEILGDHVALLRKFVVEEIFCEYLRIARRAPDIGNRAWGYILPCLTAAREIYACMWESIVREDAVGLRTFVDELAGLTCVMYGITELVAGEQREGLFSVVCAKIFDFAVFVDHVAFYLTDIKEISESVNMLVRVVESIRFTAMGTDNPRMCMESLSVERRGASEYIRASVQREMQYLKVEIENIPEAKWQELMRILSGSDPRHDLDDIVAMYI